MLRIVLLLTIITGLASQLSYAADMRSKPAQVKKIDRAEMASKKAVDRMKKARNAESAEPAVKPKANIAKKRLSVVPGPLTARAAKPKKLFGVAKKVQEEKEAAQERANQAAERAKMAEVNQKQQEEMLKKHRQEQEEYRLRREEEFRRYEAQRFAADQQRAEANSKAEQLKREAAARAAVLAEETEKKMAQEKVEQLENKFEASLKRLANVPIGVSLEQHLERKERERALEQAEIANGREMMEHIAKQMGIANEDSQAIRVSHKQKQYFLEHIDSSLISPMILSNKAGLSIREKVLNILIIMRNMVLLDEENISPVKLVDQVKGYYGDPDELYLANYMPIFLDSIEVIESFNQALNSYQKNAYGLYRVKDSRMSTRLLVAGIKAIKNRQRGQGYDEVLVKLWKSQGIE